MFHWIKERSPVTKAHVGLKRISWKTSEIQTGERGQKGNKLYVIFLNDEEEIKLCDALSFTILI